MARPTPPEIADAAIDMLAQGASYRDVAASTGLGKTAVGKVAKRGLPILDARGQLTWAEFGGLFKQKIQLGLESLTPEKLRKASVRDISILMGIFTDKALVIDGRPNVISHMDTTDRRVLPELLSILRGELERRPRVEAGQVIDVTPVTDGDRQ